MIAWKLCSKRLIDGASFGVPSRVDRVVLEAEIGRASVLASVDCYDGFFATATFSSGDRRAEDAALYGLLAAASEWCATNVGREVEEFEFSPKRHRGLDRQVTIEGDDSFDAILAYFGEPLRAAVRP